MPIGGKTRSTFPSQNGGNVGLSSILEADAKQIAAMARETFEKYVFFLEVEICCDVSTFLGFLCRNFDILLDKIVHFLLAPKYLNFCYS